MSAPLHFAVFGHPIAHSLSPRLHAWFAERADIALRYDAIDVAPDAFEETVRAFFERGGCGANVTLPHKAAAFALANVHAPTAQRLKVANVLTRRPDGRIEADSNDGAGLLADLRARCGIEPQGCNVLLLGAGGAARAAAFALLDAGVARLAIANRTVARARVLADALADPARVHVSPWESLADCRPFDLIIDATSAGVQHASLALPVALLGADTLAYALSYGPAALPFVDWARQAGCRAAFDGLGMLVETAAASFQRWHGVRPDVAAALEHFSAGTRP